MRYKAIANVVSVGVLMFSSQMLLAQKPDSKAAAKLLESEVTWGKPASGWKLGVSLLDERKSIPWGEPVRVRVYLKNVSDKSREVQYAPLFGLHRFQLKRVYEWNTIERGKQQTHREPHAAPLTRYGRSLIEAGDLGPLMSAKLEPSQSLTQDLFLSRCFDMSQGGIHLLSVKRFIPHEDSLRILETPQLRINMEPSDPIPIVIESRQ